MKHGKKDVRELECLEPTLPAQEGFEVAEQELVDCVLDGIGADGGQANRSTWEAVIRTSFRSGIIHATLLRRKKQ